MVGRKQIVDGLTAMSVLRGRENTQRLVKAYPALSWHLNEHAVQLNSIPLGVDGDAQFSNGLPVDSDASSHDHGFGFPPRC
jgi:hypothetical protein